MEIEKEDGLSDSSESSDEDQEIKDKIKELEEKDLDNIYKEIYNEFMQDEEDETDEEYKRKEKMYKTRLNILKLQKELLNNKNLEKNNKFFNLYPTRDDNNFNIKIAEKKEFNNTKYDGRVVSVKEQAEILCNSEFELAPHQMFVSNFMSSNTPYNSLLLYHGLGTGKTCSAITIAEEMRDYFKQMGLNKKILIVASPNVQENFKLQLFDKNKLENINGIWNIKSCTGTKLLKEVNPMNTKDIPKEHLIKKVNNIIKEGYEFMGYVKLANKISNLSEKDKNISERKNKELIKRRLKNEFDNNLLIIDEIHNIRTSDNEISDNLENDNEKANKKTKIVLNEFEKLVENVDNMRLLLLSATPMYNTCKEIIWLINFMNKNDNRGEIKESDIFTKENDFVISNDGKDSGKELLKRKVTGSISYIRGENPYTFPFRIWPHDFSVENTFNNFPYPEVQYNKKPIIQKIEMLSLYLNLLGEYQESMYNEIIKTFVLKEKEETIFENMEISGYTILQKSLDALNIVYPYNKDNELNLLDVIGKNGLDKIMNYEINKSPNERINYEYRDEEKFGRVFSLNEIGKYSSKIKNICNCILNSEGVILIYSQYIDGGLIPLALALEELGFTRAGNVSSLFKKSSMQTENIDSLTFKSKSEFNGEIFNPAKYIMITGDKSISPDNNKDLELVTSEDNKDGSKVKVVLISQAGSEGLDFKFIRQVHIMEPWYNMNRIEQIIGRGVRTCSHKLLPLEKRNVQIFLHASILNNRTEAVDIYVYRMAELKALQIGRVSRVLKQSSIDCLLNIEQQNFSFENFNQELEIELSSKKKINYKVGDKPFTAICDYMDSCQYECTPNKIINKEDVTDVTYNETFILMNIERIVQRIRTLMKEQYIYKKYQIIAGINVIKEYPIEQINAALTQLIEDKHEYITDRYGRLGNLVNIDDLYLFQPLELDNKNISYHERSTPIDYKHHSIDITLPDKRKNYDIKINDEINDEINDKQRKKVNYIIERDNKDYDRNITKPENKKKDVVKDLDDINLDDVDLDNLDLNKLSNVAKELKDINNEDKEYQDREYEDYTPKHRVKGVFTNQELELVKSLRNNFDKALTPQKINRGEIDWYIFCSGAIHKLKETSINPEILLIFLIEHIVDELNFDNKVLLFNYIEKKKISDSLDKFENYIDDYIDSLTIKKDDLHGIFLQNIDIIILIVKTKDNLWDLGTPEDVNDLLDLVHSKVNKTIIPIHTKMNKVVGYMTEFRNNITFKVRNIEKTRTKGACCTQKPLIINYLKEIYKENKFPSKEFDYSISLQELSVILEFTLRYFDRKKINKKRWFLNSGEITLSKFEKEK